MVSGLVGQARDFHVRSAKCSLKGHVALNARDGCVNRNIHPDAIFVRDCGISGHGNDLCVPDRLQADLLHHTMPETIVICAPVSNSALWDRRLPTLACETAIEAMRMIWFSLIWSLNVGILPTHAPMCIVRMPRDLGFSPIV